MSISNIKDRSTVDAVRSIDKRISRIEYQLSSFIKNNSLTAYHSALLGLDFATSSHTGFASSSSLTSHTSDSTIHFTTSDLDKYHQNYLDASTSFTIPAQNHIVACDYYELKSGAALTISADAVLCVL